MKTIRPAFLPFLIAAGTLFLFMISCKKKGNDDNDQQKPSGNSCIVAKAQAEHIQVFPADNPWNTDISQAPVDPDNDQIIAALSTYAVKADFGSGAWEGLPIGIPYVVVCGNQAKHSITWRGNAYDDNYGDESDAGPYAIPLDAPIEGNGEGDAHVIAVDKDNKILYELYNAEVKNGRWEASSGAIFNLNSNALRPAGWTSADAAGLPIFAGLVRYEELLKGEIDHALRFTLTKPNIKPAYIHPARHKVNSTGGQYALPMGARIRLRADYDISGFTPRVQIILQAMKKYGLILADIGSNFYISGAPDERWDNDELKQLGKIKGADFEVVKMN